jgi:hypothetical protein
MGCSPHARLNKARPVVGKSNPKCSSPRCLNTLVQANGLLVDIQNRVISRTKTTRVGGQRFEIETGATAPYSAFMKIAIITGGSRGLAKRG